MVLALVVLVSGVVIPSFGGLMATSRIRSAARGLLAQCRYARDLAIRRNTYARLVFDSNEQIHAVTVLEQDDETGEQEWNETHGTLGAPRRLPEGVVFDRMLTAEETGEEAVTFGPDGRAEDWFLTIRDSRGRRLAVKITGTTGGVEILSPADGAAFDELEARAEEFP